MGCAASGRPFVGRTARGLWGERPTSPTTAAAAARLPTATTGSARGTATGSARAATTGSTRGTAAGSARAAATGSATTRGTGSSARCAPTCRPSTFCDRDANGNSRCVQDA